MRLKTVLITGSGGLIGSECVKFFAGISEKIIGVDNDTRGKLFGSEASTHSRVVDLLHKYPNYVHETFDIVDFQLGFRLHKPEDIDLIIHAAGQPAHEWSIKNPATDFRVNAIGTMNILEQYRQKCPHAVFVFMSSNKVYGTWPNKLPLFKKGLRWETSQYGIDESTGIDHTQHTIYGVSKVAADLMVQEYGLTYGLKTAVLRSGCMTGEGHAGAQAHGFLNYLLKCIAWDMPYTIFGDGYQVRDNIHACDIASAVYEIYKAPVAGEVFNMGGGRDNSVSIWEVITLANAHRVTKGLPIWKKETVNEQQGRTGDHIWYCTDLRKFTRTYPNWRITKKIYSIIENIHDYYHNTRPEC